ncbi:hypothetical protein ON010_g206 [Phytophthora cinnamomi]|nr:hypothetical protein ON010_g206 [Phytophthora cinnamomi]
MSQSTTFQLLNFLPSVQLPPSTVPSSVLSSGLRIGLCDNGFVFMVIFSSNGAGGINYEIKPIAQDEHVLDGAAISR